MAVLSWWSDLSCYSVNERTLTCNLGYVGNFLAGVCVSDDNAAR